MKGMCPGGCGKQGTLKAISAHMASCPEVAKRFADGAELRSPEEEYRSWTEERAAEQAKGRAPRVPKVEAPEVSGVSATVPEAAPEVVWETPAPEQPKAKAPRRTPAPVERVAGPVFVEYWQTPTHL